MAAMKLIQVCVLPLHTQKVPARCTTQIPLTFSFILDATLYLNLRVQSFEDIMYLILETPGQHFIGFIQNE